MKKKPLIITALASVVGIAGYFVGIRNHKKQESQKQKFPLRSGVPEADTDTILGCDQNYSLDYDRKVSILITGAESYIGENFRSYAKQHYGNNFIIATLDMQNPKWREHPFTTEEGCPFDTVFHVAGIAHADVGSTSIKEQEKYYRVNTDLALEVARKSKDAGVAQFVFMSSMIVYGDTEFIDRNTKPSPDNFYGDSKWQADKGVRTLADEDFRVAVLRPPMIYGKGSKGNYPVLSKLARKLLVFPEYKNKRSMLYIENLCDFLCLIMLTGKGGIYFPQNNDYTSTSHLVREIGISTCHLTYTSNLLNPFVAIAMHAPVKKVRNLALKAFGSSYYDQDISTYKGLDYQKVDLRRSIILTENSKSVTVE